VSGGNAGAGAATTASPSTGGERRLLRSGDLFLGFGGDGGTGGQFFVNSNGFTGGSLTASGGAGGAGGSGNTAITIVNGAPATVTQATGSANVGDGGFGGSGGSISLNTMGRSMSRARSSRSAVWAAQAGRQQGERFGLRHDQRVERLRVRRSRSRRRRWRWRYVSVGGTTMTVNGTISTGGGAGGAGGNNSTAIAYASTSSRSRPLPGDRGCRNRRRRRVQRRRDLHRRYDQGRRHQRCTCRAGRGRHGSSASVSGYGPAGTGLFLDTQFGSGGFQDPAGSWI